VSSNLTLSASHQEKGASCPFFLVTGAGCVDELTEVDDPAGQPDRTRAARPERERGARAMDGPSRSHPLRHLAVPEVIL